MRLLEDAYEYNNGVVLQTVRIFSERTYGYKRFIVEFSDGNTLIYSGMWYKLDQIKREVEKEIDRRTEKI